MPTLRDLYFVILNRPRQLSAILEPEGNLMPWCNDNSAHCGMPQLLHSNKESTMTSFNFAMHCKLLMSGTPLSAPHFVIACLDTNNVSAICFCDRPAFFSKWFYFFSYSHFVSPYVRLTVKAYLFIFKKEAAVFYIAATFPSISRKKVKK